MIAVVGIGADGWEGLGEAARAAVLGANEVIGSRRQLDLAPVPDAAKRELPSPLEPLIEELAARNGAGSTCVLASGDPMLHGIGATLARRLEPGQLEIHPGLSAFALACARLRWPEAETTLVSTVARPPETVARALQPGRRLIVYTTNAGALATVLRERGFGPSRFVVLEQLGGPAERMTESRADTWDETETDPLHAVAIECAAEPGTPVRPTTPGLPDDAFEHDGQITKRHVRAVTVAALAPAPGHLLWDVGAGSGSIGIEWLRAAPGARAIAIERRAERAERARANALRLGVPELDVREGEAPAALDGLPRPDAVFIGGGVTTPGLLDACVATGARIVANAVTLEGEGVLAAARETHGGTLTRIEISHAEPVGGFTGWRGQMPVVQWSATPGAA